jgi:hypothetical protein
MKNLITPRDFYNHKRSFNVVVQHVCDTNKCFWTIFVRQPSGVHNGE